jgi:hypothetical protein
MPSNEEIVKQLRKTASATYREQWLSDDNWIELIKAHNINSTLNSLELNAAIRRDHSTKHVVDIMEGAANRTGIYRNTIQMMVGKKNRKVCYYYLARPGSDVSTRT